MTTTQINAPENANSSLEAEQATSFKTDIQASYKPVSYTHLDVYKRQGIGSGYGGIGSIGIGGNYTTPKTCGHWVN